MKLMQDIKIKERQAQLARSAFSESYRELKYVLRRRLSSRTALVAGFSGGLALGWLKGKRRRKPPARLAQRAGGSMPRNWLGSYIVWPFLLSTARDLVVSRRPSRGVE